MPCLDRLAKAIQIIQRVFAKALLNQGRIAFRLRHGSIRKVEGRLRSSNELADIRTIRQLAPCHPPHERM